MLFQEPPQQMFRNRYLETNLVDLDNLIITFEN